jgi:hypothetical protein
LASRGGLSLQVGHPESFAPDNPMVLSYTDRGSGRSQESKLILNECATLGDGRCVLRGVGARRGLTRDALGSGEKQQGREKCAKHPGGCPVTVLTPALHLRATSCTRPQGDGWPHCPRKVSST